MLVAQVWRGLVQVWIGIRGSQLEATRQRQEILTLNTRGSSRRLHLIDATPHGRKPVAPYTTSNVVPFEPKTPNLFLSHAPRARFPIVDLALSLRQGRPPHHTRPSNFPVAVPQTRAPSLVRSVIHVAAREGDTRLFRHRSFRLFYSLAHAFLCNSRTRSALLFFVLQSFVPYLRLGVCTKGHPPRTHTQTQCKCSVFGGD